MNPSRQILPAVAPPGRLGRVKRVVIACIAILMLLAGLLLFGKSVLAWWARRMATAQLRAGAVGAAQQWLAWSARFYPEDGRADLIRAACFRLLRQTDSLTEALRAAKKHGAPANWIDREAKLERIQSGQLPEDPEIELALMIQDGVPPADVCMAFVSGFLAQERPESAKKVLDAWAREYPNDPAVGYMRGLYWISLGDDALARKQLQAVLSKQPRHEPARMVLAELLERQGNFEQALSEWFLLARCGPSNRLASLSLARLLRKTGRAEAAHAVLGPWASGGEAAPDVLWEMGEIALELGRYEQAQRWFLKSQAKRTGEHSSVFATAATLALQGNTPSAETLLTRVACSATAISLGGGPQRADGVFERLDALYGWLQRVLHLRAALAADPGNRSAASELEALSAEPVVASITASPAEYLREEPPRGAESGPELYRTYCAACHGENGNGDGRAARHLYPRPKNLRSGNYRLISTVNKVPTLEDLEHSIERGMPGSSMPPFDDLDPSQRALLAREVLRFYREGVRDQVAAWLGEEGDEIEEDEIDEMVEELTTPGQVIVPPPIGRAGPEAVARGKQSYDRLGCFHCHGPDGKGPADTLLTDDAGLPTSSRNLAQEPLKGGERPEAVYLRLLLGMPGTPHPACPGLAEEELVDLVHFCLSLRRGPVLHLTNHERMIRATRAWATLPAPRE